MSVVLLSITLLAFTLQIGTQPVAMAVPPRQVPPLTPGSSSTALMAITPSNFSDTSLTSGTVSYTVNVYNSSAINQFDVRITYNYNVLNGASIDYSSNVLGPNVLILYNCLDGVYGGACDTLDGPGVVHMSLYIQGNVSITPPTAGILMKVKFNIVGHGFTQLHLVPGGAFGSDLLCALCAHGGANAPLTTVVPLTTQDAYFNNILCGGVLCKPPVADFTFSPSIALPGRSVTFNATASRATNVNAVIKQYFWQWNDGSIASNTDSNVTSHVFKSVNNQTVTLTVTDSDGISWSSTLIVPVIAVYIQLIAGQMTIEPKFGVHPGTIVKIIANVINNGSIAESSNMTISVEGRLLGDRASQSFSVGPFHQAISVTVTWDTTGYVPRVYRVSAVILEPSAANSTKGNVGTAYVQLIEPLPSGSLSLGLAETTGLGIVVLAAIVFIVTRLRRRPSFADEPL